MKKKRVGEMSFNVVVHWLCADGLPQVRIV